MGIGDNVAGRRVFASTFGIFDRSRCAGIEAAPLLEVLPELVCSLFIVELPTIFEIHLKDTVRLPRLCHVVDCRWWSDIF
jgi:hypothetical protein